MDVLDGLDRLYDALKADVDGANSRFAGPFPGEKATELARVSSAIGEKIEQAARLIDAIRHDPELMRKKIARARRFLDKIGAIQAGLEQLVGMTKKFRQDLLDQSLQIRSGMRLVSQHTRIPKGGIIDSSF